MITLPRTGLPDLVFDGELIGEAGQRPDTKPDWKVRWHELALYKTDSDKYVGYLRFCTEHDRETPQRIAIVAPSQDQLVNQLADYDPCEWLDPYPDHPKWQKKRERRAAALQDQFDEVCNQAYAEAGFVERL